MNWGPQFEAGSERVEPMNFSQDLAGISSIKNDRLG